MSKPLDDRFREAVAHFWRVRAEQQKRQGETGSGKDRGSRSAVTGGKQLDGFVAMVRAFLCEAGLCENDIHVERRRTVLPGYYRPTKEWDIVAIVNGRLLATIEFKSQIGPSFGNNFNNRTEEAVGSAHDLWTAFKEGAYQQGPRPWLGYLMPLEDCPASRRPVSVEEPHFPVFPEFRDTSYAKRYEILCNRLVRQRLYDAACFLTTSADEGIHGEYHVPSPESGPAHFAASLEAHARMFLSPPA